MSRSIRVWLVVIVVVAGIWWFVVNGGGSKIPVINTSWTALNAWFKTTTGIGLDQIGLALWRLVLWVVKTVVAMALILARQVLDLFQK